jgi:hypothetical protein
MEYGDELKKDSNDASNFRHHPVDHESKGSTFKVILALVLILQSIGFIYMFGCSAVFLSDGMDGYGSLALPFLLISIVGGLFIWDAKKAFKPGANPYRFSALILVALAVIYIAVWFTEI